MWQWIGSGERLPQLTRDDWHTIGVLMLALAVAWCIFQ